MESSVQSGRLRPSHSITEQTIKLSLCDAYAPKVWVIQTHFWPLPPEPNIDSDGTASRHYHILREALSRTLSEVPILAGHVMQQSSDPRDLAIHIGQDAHVDFFLESQCDCPDVPPYAELKAAGWPISPELKERFSVPLMLEPVYEGSPTFVAKLNILKGGLALTVGVNHLIADAAAVNELEKIWSHHASDVSNNLISRHRADTCEAKIRARLSKPISNAVSFNNQDWQVFPASQSQLALPKRSLPTALETFKEGSAGSEADQKEPTHWCIWRLDAASLAEVKQKATTTEADHWISTLDAVVGLFWSRLSKVKQHQIEGSKQSKVFMSINIRHRLQAPLHSQYIGNAVDMVSTSLSGEELLAESTSFSAASYGARAAINSWSESEWAAWLTTAANLESDNALCPSPAALLAPQNLGVTDASKIETHLFDWGPELGNIEKTRYMMPASGLAGYATLLTVYPRLKDGGLEVGTILTPAIKDALQQDAVFSGFASLVCVY